MASKVSAGGGGGEKEEKKDGRRVPPSCSRIRWLEASWARFDFTLPPFSRPFGEVHRYLHLYIGYPLSNNKSVN